MKNLIVEKRAYFDWAATALPDESVLEEKVPFANPSSLHSEGRAARAALENARERCAAILRVSAKTIYFTSGGTESNAIVLHSALVRGSTGPILVSTVEHPSIRENCRALERLGKQTGAVSVEKDGRLTPVTLTKALDKYPDVRVAALMALNNETGAVMDIEGLVRCIRARERAPVHIHSDLVQAIGKVPVSLSAWDVDSGSISAHKLGGPRGIGLLYLRKRLDTLYVGGGQERGVRPGTENTAGALALAACLERYAGPDMVLTEHAAACVRCARLINGLLAIPGTALIPTDRAATDERFSPYILQVAFRNIPGEVMVRALDDAGFAVSTGSACSSAGHERPVLAAMGLDQRTRLEGIRISQGYSTTMEEIERLLEAIQQICDLLGGIV
ncbi:MAG: cysteine desulfurase [Treponema sp.]|jgi:cysteine desulfurase|nr:cysteine desulfurase [Treponema sp.]